MRYQGNKCYHVQLIVLTSTKLCFFFRSENSTGVSSEQRKKDSEVKERKGGKKKGSLEGNDAIQDKTENTFRFF